MNEKFAFTIVQLSGEIYFWTLTYQGRADLWPRRVATSTLIGPKEKIEKEVDEIAKQLQINTILVSERS